MESFAYETNKMEELYDYGPDLLSDRVSFEALISELYPTDSSMQLDVEFSSRGTSPPGPDTPPSSSGGGQEEVASLETGEEHHVFQGALMTEMLAGMGGSTSNDLMRSGANIYHDMNSVESSLHESYLGVPSSSQYSPSQMAAYSWDSFPERFPQHGTIFNTNFSWVDPAIDFNNPNQIYHPGGQAIFDPTAFIPRSMMTAPHIPFAQSPIDSVEHGLITEQGSIPLQTLQHDDTMLGYRELSSPDAMMISTGYQINNDLSDFGGFNMLGQPAIGTSQQPETSLIPEQPPIVVGETLTSPAEPTTAVETADLPIRNNYRSREPNISRSPEIARRGMASRPSSSRDSSPRPHKGGRSGGLDGNTRAHANQMRKLGACWICAFQRDQCDPGSPCTRCQDRSIRGSLHMLPCSRMHLQELVHQFLPATMNRQHRREEILSFAKKSLGFWRADAPIQVHLTSLGLGQFTWDLHEYEPSSQDLLLQKRYKVGVCGTWQRVEKRSPPLAVKQVNFGHMHKLEEYVDDIIDRHLELFQKQAYYGEEDSTAVFQNELLQALCTLYTSLPDSDDVRPSLPPPAPLSTLTTHSGQNTQRRPPPRPPHANPNQHNGPPPHNLLLFPQHHNLPNALPQQPFLVLILDLPIPRKPPIKILLCRNANATIQPHTQPPAPNPPQSRR
jgi:hypothetical protein